MGNYIVTARGPSLEGYEAHKSLGYTGSYTQYAEAAWRFEGARIFINGDLGPHCTDCPAPSDVLCDYPVGDSKTCDRPMCRDHSHAIGGDIDYCPHHYKEWLAYAATNAPMDELSRIAEKRLPARRKPSND